MKLEHYFPNALSEGEIHVWYLVSNDEPQEIIKHMACLSAREKDKSNRFKIEKDRLAYITCHVFLRKVLAYYLNVTPDHIKFTENDYGKPFIDDPVNSLSLQFSLSKSHNHVLLAVTQNRLIGCDIERQDEQLDYKAIINNYFSAQEKMFIQDSGNQRTGFFDYWTAKESYIKARGEGLSLPLDQFTLYIDNNEDVSMLENLVAPDDVEKWQIRRLKVAAGFSTATCVSGKINTIKLINVN